MVRKIRPLTAVFIILFLVGIPRGWADFYIWTDENGIRHYSNISPPDRGGITQMAESLPNLLPGTRFKVVRVFDGDTIEARGSGLTFKVRLVGIDSPEKGRKGQKGQPFALKAKQTLAKLVSGRQIRLKQYGTGGYNRLLAEVFADARNINLEMLKSGLAEVYGGKMPKGLNADAYQRAQTQAKAKRLGIWSLGKHYKSPRQWRKENPWK
ncbi:MAG: thermonuclease family protein [Desulfobacter sp.]|nr:MAG: thermonuclease family protein [Desulfobacter sp.]